MQIHPNEITRAGNNLQRLQIYEVSVKVTNAKDGRCLPGPCPIWL